MRKNIYFKCVMLCMALLSAAMAVAQGKATYTPFVKGVQTVQKNGAVRNVAKFRTLQAGSAKEGSSIPTVTVLDEHFDKWTAGTNDKPDTKALGGSGVDYVIPADLTVKSGWKGAGVYQAGGACSLQTYTTFEYGQKETINGYIDTPEMELYGTVVLTLRARRQKAGNGADLRIALCDNYEGPLDDRIINLTDDWAEYRFETNKALFGEIEIFQIEGWNGNILIDDVKITRKRDIIESPYVLDPINNSATSFTARWNKTSSAKSYRVNVYRKEMPQGEVYQGKVVEGFDQMNILSDGKTIDQTNPNYPEGWTIDLSSHGSTDVYTTADNYNSPGIGLCFDEEGDVVESPEMPAPLTEFSFWVRPSSMEQESDFYYSMLQVSVFHKNKNRWEAIANMPNYYISNPKGQFYSFTHEQLEDDAVKVKIEFIQHNAVTFAVDDVTLGYSTQKVPVTQQLTETADTFLVVNNVDPEYEYYYNVTALDGELHSQVSEDMWVNGVVGLKADALPATDVSDNGFTANWKRKATATRYRLGVYRSTDSAIEDIPDFIVLHEDFNKVDKGTLENPDNPWVYNVDLSEEGMADTDWQLQLPRYVEGMAGAGDSNPWMQMNGLVSSPKMSLTANGGAFDVDITAYGTEAGDNIYAMLLKNPLEGTALAFAMLPVTTAYKEVKATLHFDAAADLDGERSNVYLVFMSANGKAFFIDDVTVRQDIKKGDKMFGPVEVVYPETTSYAVTGIDGRFTHWYDVVDIAHKTFTDYYSDRSDLVRVATPTGISGVAAAQNGIHVQVAKASLTVSADAPTDVYIYDVQGRKVAALSAVSTQHTLSLAPALYVVKGGNTSVKVLVP